MNEPRSQAELYIVVRQTTDGSKIYNISYNPADDLQSWIEDMAAYVKSLDPIHLLSTGQLSSVSEVEHHVRNRGSLLPELAPAACVLQAKLQMAVEGSPSQSWPEAEVILPSKPRLPGKARPAPLKASEIL